VCCDCRKNFANLHCLSGQWQGKVLFMMKSQPSDSRKPSLLCGLLILAAAPGYVVAEPAPAAASAFNSYISAVESRLAQQHRSQKSILATGTSNAQSEMRLRRGDLMIEKLASTTGADFPGAMLLHWRGTAFVPGATAADLNAC
jgi:hypothetical protein